MVVVVEVVVVEVVVIMVVVTVAEVTVTTVLGVGAVVIVPVTPIHEQALEYRTEPEQAEA